MLVSKQVYASECTDRRSRDDIACPVLVVVDPRHTGESRHAVSRRTNYPPRIRPPVASLGRYECGERKG